MTDTLLAQNNHKTSRNVLMFAIPSIPWFVLLFGTTYRQR